MKYTGDGRFLIGIPAIDLSEAEIKALAEARNTTPAALRKMLGDSGLYGEKKKP